MLASTTTVHAMSAGWQALFFALAVVAFVAILVWSLIRPHRSVVYACLGFGLACFVFVFLWNAIAAA